jgi:glycosyltransferase involved in cell wall biosynthesis
MKTLAIIITSYKSEQYILETLKSLENQLLPENWAIKFYIGVDACENTADILKKNLYSFYFSEKNVGTYILSNSLIKIAKAENCDMFLRFDSDDLARDNFLFYGINHTLLHDFVRPYYNYCNSSGKPKGNSNSIKAHGPVFISRKALNDVGGYYHYRVACDSDLIRRAERLGYVSTIKEKFPLFWYRKHATSLTKSADTSKKSEFRKQVWAEMTEMFDKGINKIDSPVIVDLVYFSNSK